MNSFAIATLARPSVRSVNARFLSSVPGSHRAIGLMHPPAERAFAAFVAAFSRTRPTDWTACEGWTVHELTAHLAAGSAEIADLIDLELADEPSRPTRDFEEREAPFRAMAPRRLRRAFFETSLRATVAIERLRRAGRRVMFTGAALDADTLILHAESELALHRWDLVGTDETSIELLSDRRLHDHAVHTVAAMTPNVFATMAVDGAAAGSLHGARPRVRIPMQRTVAAEGEGDPREQAAHDLLRLWGRDPRWRPGVVEPISATRVDGRETA